MTASPSEIQDESPQANKAGLAKAFSGIPDSDYVRDVLALVLLGASLKLPVTAIANHPVAASSQALYVLVTAVAALALTLPYLSRFGIMPKGWTVAATRSLRIVLALPYLGYFLWLLVGPLVTDASTLGVGSAFAIGGAGVALAAQARSSELGPIDQDRSAKNTAVLVATLLVTAMAVTYVASLVMPLLKAKDLPTFPYLAVIIAFVTTAAFILLPAIAVVLKKTAGWRSYVMGLGIALVIICYFGADGTGLLPSIEAFTALTEFPANSLALFLPLSFTLGVGSFIFPALAAVVAAPAFDRATLRNSPLEQRLDLAAITLRMIALVGGVLILISGAYLIEFKNISTTLPSGSAQATGQVITILVLGVVIAGVSLGALRSFNANPAGSRISMALALGVTALAGLIIMSSAPIFGEKILVAGHLIIVLALPAIGAYAIIGNKDTQTFFANYAARRPAPSTASYEWVNPHDAHPAGVEVNALGTGAVPVTNQPYFGNQAPASAAGPAQNQSQPVFPHGTAAGTTQPQMQETQTFAQPNLQEPAQVIQHEPQPAQPQNTVQPQNTEMQQPEQPSDAAQGGHADEISTQTVSRTAVAKLMQQHAADAGETQVIAQPPVAAHGFTRDIALDPLTPAVVLAKIAEVAPELRPALAENPATYDALLVWLAQMNDPNIDAALQRRNN